MARISIPLHGWAIRLLALLLAAGTTAHLAAQGNDEVTPEVQQLYAEARAAQQHGDTATAISKYRAMIKVAPHLAAAYNNLGMLYFNEHDYPHAAEVLKRGLELNPEMPTASAMLGMSYFQLGENEKAEPLLRAALRANPNDDNVEMILCHILINLKRYDEAASYLKKFLDRNPKDQEAWYLLGKTYLQMSEDALAKIDQIDPNSVVAHEIAGEIDESMHNYDLALVEYKKAIDMAPHRPGTHMHMANALWLTAKWASAETGVQGGARERSQQLHGALEACQRDAGSRGLGGGRPERAGPSHRPLPGADAGARGPWASLDSARQARRCTARFADGRERQPIGAEPPFSPCVRIPGAGQIGRSEGGDGNLQPVAEGGQ